MAQPENHSFSADSVNLLNIAVRYRRLLLITAVTVFVISAAVAFLIRPLYRATVVLYPTTNVSESQSLFGIQTTATPLFGDESSTEKVLQILKSDNIKNFIVAKYDLMNHYGISPKARFRYTELDLKLKRYIVSRKTEYSSVEIDVLDPDPVMSAAIANDISHRVDTVFNQIVRGAGLKAAQAISVSYTDQLRRVKSLEDSIRGIVPAGMLGSLSTTTRTGIQKGNWAPMAGQYSPEFLRLINMFQAENESLSAIRNRLTEARMASVEVLPYTHIINAAQVPEKKALPKRVLIVAGSVVLALLLLVFVLAARETTRKNG
jgi:uncharacterized protein involved in exopolysaccharide biosynthesis